MGIIRCWQRKATISDGVGGNASRVWDNTPLGSAGFEAERSGRIGKAGQASIALRWAFHDCFRSGRAVARLRRQAAIIDSPGGRRTARQFGGMPRRTGRCERSDVGFVPIFFEVRGWIMSRLADYRSVK